MKTFTSRITSDFVLKGDGTVQETQTYPIAATYDVIVAGGGPAGIGAAIGAARQGARVLLVERNSFLGGTATAVQMATWNMSVDKMTGYAKELATSLVNIGGATGGGTTVPFDPESVKELTLASMLEHKVELLLYSSAVAPLLVDGRVQGLIIENKSGRLALSAPVVIDCTGDADVAARAGATYVMGRENDTKMRPMTVLVRLAGLDLKKMVQYAKDNPEEFDPDTTFHILDIEHGLLRFIGFYKHIKEAHERGDLDERIHYLRFEGIQVENGVAFLNSVRVYDVDGTNGFDLTRAEIEARQQVEQLVDLVKNHVPGCENAYVVDTSSNMGVRETRRIVGVATLDEADVVANAEYDDTIAEIWRYHAPGHDMHSPDPIEGSASDPLHRGAKRPLRSFQIPFGVLVPAELDGLLVAGRAISTTHAGDAWTRGMYCCIVTGQAAGVAAALAASSGIQPRNVDISMLRAALRKQDIDLGAA
ncbi:MAG: dependent oxidoreductase [Schumannella sp.]|nr:dependent oxidoreductase [Schumannella sp.]